MTVRLPDMSGIALLLLPQINVSDIQMLWHCAFYDGPRDGVIMYRQRPCWFTIREDADDFRDSIDEQGQRWSEWHTRFIVIELTDAQFSELHERNQLFREKVGTHWDYDAQGKRIHGQIKPQESRSKYYEIAKTWALIDLSQSHIVGWFERLFKRVEKDENL